MKARDLQKIRIAVSRRIRLALPAGSTVIYAGIGCCAAALVLVLAVAVAGAV
jgi:hypothetical protein